MLPRSAIDRAQDGCRPERVYPLHAAAIASGSAVYAAINLNRADRHRENPTASGTSAARDVAKDMKLIDGGRG